MHNDREELKSPLPVETETPREQNKLSGKRRRWNPSRRKKDDARNLANFEAILTYSVLHGGFNG